MALALNEEQQLLKDTAREFLAEHAPVTALRKLRDEGDATGYDRQLWRQMSELGWAGMVLPEAYGGLAFGFVGLGAVIEESGHTLAASPLFATVVLGASLIELAADEALKTELLPQVASGDLTLALALEEGPHHDPQNIACQAVADGDGFVINGRKTFVLDGHSADKLIVVARTAGDNPGSAGLGLFLVDGSASGVTRKRMIMADSRNAAEIQFDDVRIAAADVIGDPGNAWPALERALDRGRACIAAEMLGGASECFARTLAYLKEREQFGVKIGSFQALQHRAAQMYADIEMSKSVVLDALSALDDGRDDAALAASHAKAQLNDVYIHVTNEAVQMHGGIGVTDELDIGLFLKRARVAAQILGDSNYHTDRFATLGGY